MILSFKFSSALVLSCLAITSQAGIIQTAGILMRGKNVLEFYETAIANPQQVILLSVEIYTLFQNSSTRYKDLNNDIAQKVGWFNLGPLGLEHIELRPEPSPGYQYGYYSITLKKLTFKQCEALSNYAVINRNFVSVELNHVPVFVNGSKQPAVAVCKSQWFFQDGKKELKYVGN